MRGSPESYGMQTGKFAEKAMLGEPRKFESVLPVAAAFSQGRLAHLVRENLGAVMQEIRGQQSDDPMYPRKPFNRRLLNDVESGLEMAGVLPAYYQVRVYSALGTALDATGVDFWVELYDEDEDRVLTSYKIDLKTNPHGRMGQMADQAFYCDGEVESLAKVFETKDYKILVANIVEHFGKYIEKLRVVGRARHVTRNQLQL